jgi:hypothetical protein
VRYRLKFIKRYFKYEYQTYRWVQLCKEDATSCLAFLEKEPLKKDLQQSYIDDQRNAMREYHSDCHNALKECIADLENLPFGYNLATINFAEGEQPIIFVGQDEAIIYQYMFSLKYWHGPEGKGILHPKGQGDQVMTSAFTGDQIGFGKSMTDEQLLEINQLRNNQEYVS